MNWMTLKEAAESRRSIRKYTDEPIPEDTLREIIRLSGLAPSPWNLQPWRLVVVQEPNLKEQLMEAAYGQPQVGRSQATIVLYSDMENVLKNVLETVHPGMPNREDAANGIEGTFAKMSREQQESWGRQISYIYLGYLLLAIEAAGYSSSPMLGFDPAAVKKLLDLPEHAEIPAIVAVGKADEDGFTHHRHPLDRYVRFA